MGMKAVFGAITATGLSVGAALAADDVVVVYDASGSMWGQIDGISKIEIARDVMADLVTGWPEDTNLGLVAYGHRSEGDCRDIETLITPGPVSRSHFIEVVNGIRPKGKTPLTAAIQQAADVLSYRDTAATVVLISDGLETCQADPCALAEDLARQGVGFTAHVVGFDLEDSAQAGLACIAENTGGVFVPATNANELKDALTQVQSLIDQPAEEPAPEPEPEADITLSAPETATTGANFTITWSASIHPQDYITIVPAGADEGAYTDYIRVRDVSEGQLTAPADPGLYEVRYVLSEGNRTLAATPVEVVAAEVGIAAPPEVTTGANFTITWSASIHPQDYITIVPAGAEEGAYTDYIRVRDVSEGQLTAPADPGLYEVRYVLNEGNRTLASAPIEVIAAEVGIAAPPEVTTGANFTITWSASIHPQDYITIVPAGAEEGAYTDYIRVRDVSEGQLTAPADPGLYEVRYVLNEGNRTLASAPIEVIAAEVGIAAPPEVTTGANFTITWSASIHPQDYITIVPAGAEEGAYTDYIRVSDKSEGQLTAPADPGLHEVRYVLNEGNRTLAAAPVEVIAANVTITGPDVVRAETMIQIAWTGAAHPQDYITIVPAGADEGAYTDYIRVRDTGQGALKAPADPGLYEIRYMLAQGDRTLASHMVEVVGATAALSDGVEFAAPTQAAPGETITISWAGSTDSADQRIALARADQADFSWITAHKLAGESEYTLGLPDQPGWYEIRYLDVSARKVLARAMIEVR